LNGLLNRAHRPADPNEAILDSTMAGILRDAATRAPDRLALVAGTADPASRVRRTDAELAGEATAVAQILAERFAQGERIAVLAPSTPDFFTLRAGASSSPSRPAGNRARRRTS
jgi:fatty-acyl-CoA synthase